MPESFIAVDANYNWTPPGRSPSFRIEPQDRARLGWWVLLAVLLSILVHIFLIIIFDVIKVQQWTPSLIDTQKLLSFKTSRVTISKSALDEMIPSPESSKETKENPTPLVDESLNEFELQEFLADMEVKLTPQVTEATRVLTSETPAVAKGELKPEIGEAPASTPEKIEVDMASLKSQLLEATRASEHQPLLELNVTPSSQDGKEILESGSPAGTEDGNEELTKGFSNLDQLLAQTGPLSDNTKPILMPTDLLFDYNQATLREEAKLSLMRLGILIQRNPDSEFVIEGHTDTLGSVGYNQDLSNRRAYSVRDWLVNSLQIDADNVRAVGFGKSRPLVNPNGSIEEQALNRRVEIVINKRAKPPKRA